jgi:DNA-binding transcriptional LysR family regulator
MEMNQVRYFLALCEEKHFTRAAARCGVAQPSLTTAMKKLEQEFGGSLFDRRRGEPTELGLLVRPFLQGIAWNAATAMSRAQSLTATTAPEAEINGAADTPFPAAAMPADATLARPAVGRDAIKWMPLERDARKGVSAME